MTLLKATAVSVRKCCHGWPYHKRKWQIENAGKTSHQSSEGSVLERFEFSEKQCELQAAAPWLRESPMLCHFVKPGNNSHFAPLRQVAIGPLPALPEATLPIWDLQMKLLLKGAFRAAEEPPHKDHGWAEARVFCFFLSIRRLRLAEEVFICIIGRYLWKFP